MPEVATLVPLTKIQEFFQKVDMKNAPGVITMEIGKCKVVYLRQPKGYAGVVHFGGRRHPVQHYVTITGEKAGWVSPAGVTNLLCQEDYKDRKRVSSEEYHSTIKTVLVNLMQAMWAIGEDDKPNEPTGPQVEKLLSLQPWVKIRKGSNTDEELTEMESLGLANYLLDFSRASNYRIVVDPKTYLENQPAINTKYMRIVEGEWDDVSERASVHFRLRASVVNFAKRNGLRLENIPRTPQPRDTEENN